MMSATKSAALTTSERVRLRTTIAPSRGWSSLRLGEVWERRELLYFLLVREIVGVYRQTALGLFWIFLRPVIQMLLLTMVFGRIVRVPSDGLPYPVFALAALLPWTFFSNAVTKGARSLVDNLHLIAKVYFPRLMIPIAAATSGLIDFIASFIVLLAVLSYYDMPLRSQIVALPFFLAITLGFALAVGLWLSTLTVKYRDISFAVAFLLQALMYASPVIYPLGMVPAGVRPAYEMNPLAVVIQGFRWSLLGSAPPTSTAIGIACAIVVVGLVSGAYVFTRTERTVVDHL